MIKAIYNKEILDLILRINRRKDFLKTIDLPVSFANKMRLNSQKVSSFASNRIEGNPLTLEQACEVIDSKNRHFLKPEQEIRNYFRALQFLDKCSQKKRKIDLELILELQKIVVKGESEEKIGIRGAMPPGVLFAVYDSSSHKIDYIPPYYEEINDLLDELIKYINENDDHVLLKAAILHYQLVTIHPFEDGNGRTTRLITDYFLSINGFGFKNLGSLEEYFSYNHEEYYSSLQMNLPPLYYEGRNNPPHPEIWITYFLRMVDLYSEKVIKLAQAGDETYLKNGWFALNEKSRSFLKYLLKNTIDIYTPKEASKLLNVTNRTIINWSSELVKSGFLKPNIVKERILSYELTDLSISNKRKILKFELLTK